MEKDSKIDDLPPSYEDACGEPTEDRLEPAVLVLKGQTVHVESKSAFAPSTRLYEMNRTVTRIPQEGSSVIFERVVPVVPEKPGYKTPQCRNHLYFLVHPAHAQYRSDLPSQYYITSASPDSLGNIRLETSKSVFQKTEFTALLSVKRRMHHVPLFDDVESERVLFSMKPKWTGGGRYKFMDADGREVACEDGDGDERKLVVTASMERAMRDALVAVWILKVWHDTMESKEAKREGKLGSATNWPPGDIS